MDLLGELELRIEVFVHLLTLLAHAVATYHSHTRGSNYSPPNMGDFRGAALSGVAAFTGHGLLNVSVINTVGPGTASPVLGNPNLGRPPGGITSFNPRHILPEND